MDNGIIAGMKPKLVAAVLIVAALIFFSGCAVQNSDLSVKYKAITQAGIKDYTTTINVSPDGNYDFEITGQIQEKFSKKLSQAEIDELIQLVQKNNFFSLPEDLSAKPGDCMDGATVQMEITLNGQTHKSGGYCVQDNGFSEIGQKLYDIYQFDPAIVEKYKNLNGY
ncbi:MAG: hypothetical protein AABW99_02090 [archaeon]